MYFATDVYVLAIGLWLSVFLIVNSSVSLLSFSFVRLSVEFLAGIALETLGGVVSLASSEIDQNRVS